MSRVTLHEDRQIPLTSLKHVFKTKEVKRLKDIRSDLICKPKVNRSKMMNKTQQASDQYRFENVRSCGGVSEKNNQ